MGLESYADPYSSVCAVSIKLPDGDSNIEGTASGIMIDPRQGLVLTHASILYSLLEKCNKDRLQRLILEGRGDRGIFASRPYVEVILPNAGHEPDDTYLTVDRNIHPVNLLSNTTQDARSFVKCQGKVKTIFVCKRLQDVILRWMQADSWQFIEDINAEDSKTHHQDSNLIDKSKLCYNLLPFFILIKIQNIYNIENDIFSIRDSANNKEGDPVEICATPFGSMSPTVFLNAKSRGILSKVAGPRGVLLMTDARCVPGSEGGALFYCHKRKRLLTGIMIASLCWKNNEWVGLSLACAINEVLGSLKPHLTYDLGRIKQEQYVCGFDQGFMASLVQNVRCVNVGHNWGSGVVIDPKKRLILTCSHVLNGAQYSGVRVTTPDSMSQSQCNVIYKTPTKSQFDLAIIQEECTSLQPIEHRQLAFGRAVEGEVVYVIGHAIFRGRDMEPPMVCRGIVSKIVRHNNIPVMLQTTCAVHAGASGGGVFNTHGQLVAIVVCNSKDTVSGACYPHVNMCIPMGTVASVVRQYMQTEDAEILKSLHITNTAVTRIWSIGTEGCMVMSHM